MSLPLPTVRPDAVEHYAEILDNETLPSEALCLTAVRGVSVEQALVRFDAVGSGRAATLDAVGLASVNAFPDELPLVVAGERDGWVILAENNGFQGAQPQVLSRLSEGTVAASVYWNVNLDNAIGLAHDGEALAEFDFVTGAGVPAPELAPFLAELDFEDAELMCAAALACLERVSGVRLDAHWASTPHIASAIVPSERFALPSAAAWLSANTPEVYQAVPDADRRLLREVATIAATRACAAAGVTDPHVLGCLAHDVEALPREATQRAYDVLTMLARGEYGQALSLRWDRCGPDGGDRDRDARLHADTTEERALTARAHAIAAVRSRYARDPADAVAQTVVNTCHAGRAQWNDTRRELALRLTERP
ncbi:DUF6461 domain-containing protein [Amycolatopsis sp. NPDC059657]|uniref:DUF6461 domain-containing protein n=1 Tax=Amycolatopsis sp. NPDC059657 TaxID=3346899 RepID=UPI00367008AF